MKNYILYIQYKGYIKSKDLKPKLILNDKKNYDEGGKWKKDTNNEMVWVGGGSNFTSRA